MPPASAPRDRRAARTRQSTSTREALRRRGPTRRQLSRHERELRHRRMLLWLGGGLVVAVTLVLGLGYLRENYVRASETVAVVFGERLTAQDLLSQAKPQLSQIDRRA